MTLEAQQLEAQPAKENERFDPQSIVIVTTTFYPNWQQPESRSGEATVDNIRGDLAILTLESALNNNFRIVVVDGGSSNYFKNALSQKGILISPETERGMSGSRRQGFREASESDGVNVICWMEPEKVSMAEKLITAIQLILEGKADIVIPKRNEAAFATYPDYQAGFEKRANKLWNDILRKHGLWNGTEDLDVWFGPRFFRNNHELLELFLRRYEYPKKPESLIRGGRLYEPELWPNAIFLPIVNALHAGHRVISVTVDYKHPPSQTASEVDSPEFGQKRALQLHNIIIATTNLVHSLEDNPKGKFQLK